jgi:hypothetical protein
MTPAALAKVGLSLTALFVFGGVCGFAIATRRWSNPTVRARLEDRWIEARRREDAMRLKLTPDQLERVGPVYQQMLADIRAVRENAGAGVVDAAKKQARGMWPLLTPEQQQEFLRLSEERQAQLQRKGSS